MLLISSDNLRLSYSVFFHSGLQDLLYLTLLLLQCPLVVLHPPVEHRSVYFSGSFCLIPQKDRSGLLPAEEIDYVHLVLHDKNVEEI